MFDIGYSLFHLVSQVAPQALPDNLDCTIMVKFHIRSFSLDLRIRVAYYAGFFYHCVEADLDNCRSEIKTIPQPINP